MQPDIDKYMPHLAGLDLGPQEKAEIIHIIFRMMESFVDQAFQADPTQQALAAKAARDSRDAPDGVHLTHIDVTKSFSRKARGEPAPQPRERRPKHDRKERRHILPRLQR